MKKIIRFSSTMQSKLHSLIESVSNVAIGYAVAILAQILIFPLYGMQVSIAANLEIGAWFTIISIGRSYCVRRIFNSFHRKPEQLTL